MYVNNLRYLNFIKGKKIEKNVIKFIINRYFLNIRYIL
jgi:hypothetical protein